MTDTTVTYASPATDRFQIGQVISQTFAVLGRKLPILLFLGVICLVIPPVLGGTLALSTHGADRPVTSFWEAAIDSQEVGNANPLNSLISIVSYVATLYYQVCAMQIVIADLTRSEPKRDQFGLAWRRILPYFGVLIVMGLAIVLGAVLLIVPGIMIAVALSVAMPVIVWEPGRGVMGAIQRSRDLTRGNRWRIFLLGLLYYIALALIFGVSALLEIALHLPADIWLISVGVLLAAGSTLLTTAGIAALYAELRKAKEGGSATEVAAAFS